MKKIINSYRELSEHKCLLFIAMLYVVVTTVPSLFLYRFIQLGPLVLPGGMFIFPCIYILGDVIAEVYGFKVARLIIWYSLICNFIFAFTILSVIYLPFPSATAHVANQYAFVFHHILRGDIANLAGVLVGSFLNAYLLTKWKILVKGRMFIVRSFTSSAIGELVMLSIWVTIAFSGKLTDLKILHLAFSDYAVRLLYALIFATPAAWIVRLIRNWEQVDIYDYSTDFNPFALNIQDKN